MAAALTPLRIRRALPMVALGFLAATAIAIALIDRPLARYYGDHGVEARATWTAIRVWIDRWTGLDAQRWFVDDVTGLALHKWFAATVLCAIGAGALAMRRFRGSARIWFFAAAVHVIARLATNELKPLLGRLRPLQWLDRGGPSFFEGGISFPSGHATYYLSLVLPFAVAWPRIGLPLLIVPCFVAWSRVAVDAHFAGDVLASAVLVTMLTWALALVFRVDGRTAWKHRA